MTYHLVCPKCSETMQLEFEDRILYFENICENCNYKFTNAEIDEIYEDALIDDVSSKIDYAVDFGVDNVYNYDLK